MRTAQRLTGQGPQISLLVPYRANPQTAPERAQMWEWLSEYWRHELPKAEIVMGTSLGRVFSKTDAVNDAARKARGRVFVLLDADCYLPGSVIQHCADEIERFQARGKKLWFVPYRRLYRLSRDTSIGVLGSESKSPTRFPSPPPLSQVESTLGSLHGKRFGALIQIMPREAFELVNGMDPRFQGWGGEDISLVRAVDTLYVHHKTTDNDVLHLWHANTGATHMDRLWDGQTTPRTNERLASRYNMATGDRDRMRRLVDEVLPGRHRAGGRYAE